MPSFTIRCDCGERYHVDESAVGRRIACRRCGAVLDVARPASQPEPPSPTRSATKRRRKRHEKTTKAPSGRHGIVMPARRGSRAIAALAWMYLAATLLIAATMWVFGDRTIVGTVLLFMGRWVFLLPLALLVPVALWLRPASLAVLLAAALVVIGPIMGFRTGWRRLLPDPEGAPLRVVTFNAEGGRILAQILPSVLDRWQAQVAAFQECGPELAAAARLVPGWHVFATRDLCLLSRYPILDSAVMDRSALDRVKQSRDDEIGGAGYVVRFVLGAPTGPIRVANLHLETPRKGFEGLMKGDLPRLRMNTEIRDIESHLARAWVDSGTGPLLVLGDFNTPVESRIFGSHWGDLADAFSVAGSGFGMTKYNGWIRARIDHVLAGPEWHVDRARVGRDAFSDHRPLIVDLTLVGARTPLSAPPAAPR
jgi:endonuclease/exonuclease/phosphatase (EEP) superfamily protein YafD